MSDTFKLRKNPESGEVFLWEPGMSDWKPVQARKNAQSGEVFVFGEGDKDWRNLGKYDGVQVRPQGRTQAVKDIIIDERSAAPAPLPPMATPDMRAPRIDRRTLAQDTAPDQLLALLGGPAGPGALPQVDTAPRPVPENAPMAPAPAAAPVDPLMSLLVAPKAMPARGLGATEAPAPKPARPRMQFEPFDPMKHEAQDVGLGGPSTEYLATNDAPDGGFWNIPQIWWDKDGKPRLFEGDQAQQIAEMYERETGKRFPRFSTPEEGAAAAEARSAGGGATQGALIQTPGAEQGLGARAAAGEGVMPFKPGTPDDLLAAMNNLPPAPGAAPLPEWQPDTEFGKGVKTGMKGAAQMATAAATIPIAGIDQRNMELLRLYETVDQMPRDAKGEDIIRALGLDMTNPHDQMMLTRAQDFQRMSDDAQDSEIATAGSALSSNKELLAGMVETIKAYSAEMEQTQGRVPNFTDIRDVKAFADWFMFNTGQAIPYLAVTALAGAAGGVPGVLASGYGMGVGDIQAGLVEQDITDGGGAALLGAIPYAALEYLGPAARYFRPSKKVLGEVAKGYFKRLGREVPANAIEEFINEAGQEIIKDYAVAGGGGAPVVIDDQKLLNWFNSGMAGAAPGALGGAVTATKPDQMQPAAVRPPPRKPEEAAPEPPPDEPQAAPTENVQPEPDRSQTGAETGMTIGNTDGQSAAAPSKPANPRVQIMDEVENNPETGERVPTGRKVAYNLDTGEVTPVEDGPSPSAADAVPPQPNPEPETGPAPEAGAVDPVEAETESKIRRVTLNSEEVAKIETDAKTFQYKDGGDQSGVTDRLQGVPQWDERAAGGGIVYEYADGRRVVADGHQRLGLAKNLQAQGQKTPWQVEVIREADGYTPADARRIAALQNISQGSGTAIDAAKVLREAPDEIDALPLPPKSALVRDAKGLAKLSDEAFGAVVNEVVSPAYGAAVGRLVKDKAAHEGIIGLLAKVKPGNQVEAEIIIEQAAQNVATETQTDLFGDRDINTSLYLERAKVLNNALGRIKQDRKTFQTLTDRADTIASAGNVLNQEANAERLDADAKMEAYLRAEANRKGAISDALSQAARDLKANPRGLSRVVNDFLDRLRRPVDDGVRKDSAASDPATQQAAGREEVATEATPAGEQAVIPGTRDDQGADTSRAKAEADAKAKQSKMGTAKPQDGAGPLFGDEGGTQQDMFAVPAETKATKAATKERPKAPPRADKTELLTIEERDRLAALRARFRDKAKNQTSSGLDPELVAISVEMAAIYVKAGARKFRDLVRAMMEDLGLTFDKAQPYARAAYNQVRDDMELAGEDISDMDTSRDVIEQVKAIQKGEADVPGTSSDLEPDRGDADTQDDMGGADVPAPGRTDDEGAGARGEAPGGRAGGERQGGGRVSDRDAAGLGGRGDQGVQRTGGRADRQLADDPDRAGSRDRGEQGLPPDEGRAEDTARHAADSPDLSDRKAAQEKADKHKPIFGSEDSVRRSLPLLLPEQQDDVLKVEQRFAKPDGHGMLLTNGTGTGKTYSGGGVIKRFVQAGKSNILVLAPSQGILDAWMGMGADMGIPMSRLEDTKTAGSGVVVTTYANAGDNNALASREWDLVVSDEAHNLSSNAAGDATAALRNLRAITHRPQDLWMKSHMLHAEEWAAAKDMTGAKAREEQARLYKIRDAEVERFKAQPRSKVLFLSATPFAYDKNVDYAEGYLFSYGGDEVTPSGSRQDGRAMFFVSNFGYRIRYHKLTQPEAAVDTGVFEREFHEKLKREGVLSGRALDIDADYDRRFMTVNDKSASRIDEAMEHVWKRSNNKTDEGRDFQELNDHIRRNFTYLRRMQLLEAIKAKAAVPIIQKHLDMGRKVVVFHDYNVGGGFNPFTGSDVVIPTDGAMRAYAKLKADLPWVEGLNFAGYGPPIETLRDAFGDKAAFYNGTETGRDRQSAIREFNRDNAGKSLIVVQSAAGEAGISLHDTTGTHQRVLINLGMPTRPTTTLQEEGRIRRVGSVTNAAFRYLTIGTNWERTAFANKIATRSGTVENLALGDEARAIRDAFIQAYLDADENMPSDTDGIGGKDADRSTAKVTPFERAKTHYYGRLKDARRRSSRSGVDHYATPEPLAFKMVEWAGIRQYEKVLEPSAGDGAIARYFPGDADRTVIEPSSELLSRAQLLAVGSTAHQEQFEDHHIVNKYGVVVMNPPFGSGGKTAFEHLEKAMRHVPEGGRIVALVPTGPAADKRWEQVPTAEWSVSTIVLPAATFEKAGTSVATRILIMDHIGPRQKNMEAFNRADSQSFYRDLTGIKSVEQLFDRIEDMTASPRMDPVAEVDTQEFIAPPTIAEGGDAAFDQFEFDHSRSGEKMFGVQVKEKLGDRFKDVSALAKNHGGYYSKFQDKASGAKRGFLFTTEEDRFAFMDDLQKPVRSAQQRGETSANPDLSAIPTVESLGAQIESMDKHVAFQPEHFASMNLSDDIIARAAWAWEDFANPNLSSAQIDARDQAARRKDIQAIASRRETARLAGDFTAYRQADSDMSAALSRMMNGPDTTDIIGGAAADAMSFEDAMLDIRVKVSDQTGVWIGEASTTPVRPGDDFSGLAETFAEWAHREYIVRQSQRDGSNVVRLFQRAEKLRAGTAESEWLRDIILPVMPALRRELDRLNLKRVGLYIDDDRARAEDGVQGMFNAYWNGRMDILIGQSLDPLATLHHEAIHALRMMNLFTPAEWRALEIKAARSWVEKWDIQNRYPDLLPSEQIEEAIAEEFASWAKGKSAQVGHLATAFEKILRFLGALRNVLNGAGFQTAEDVFGRAYAGEIGARDVTGFAERMEAAQSKMQAAPARKTGPQARAHAATAMMGNSAHIPSRSIWDELVRNNTGLWQRLRGGAAAAHDHIDTARIKLQDRFLPVLRAQEAVIRATGQVIPEEQNAYRAEETFSGKVGRHLFEIDEDFAKPIIDIMSGAKGRDMLDVEMVDQWLYARHAVERNERIASINPRMPDGGSGMMTAEAKAILAQAAAGPNAARLEEIGTLLDKLRERTIALRLDAGLMTVDEANIWRRQYKHHVPLKGFADLENADAVLDITGVGRRFNVRGAESRMALGRKSQAFSPLEAALDQAREVSVRAEKNRVGTALYNLAKGNPSPALWKIKTPKVKQYFNRSTGLVESRVEDPLSLILKPNEMAVKIDGVEQRVVFEDIRLAEAAGTVGADRMNWFISIMSVAARIFSAVNTMLDPEFVIRNAIRDMQAAQINIRNFGEADRNKIAAGMIKNWPKAFVGAYRGQGNHADTEWTKYYREFEKAGAKVSFWKLDQPAAAREDLKKRIRMATPGTAARNLRFFKPSTRDNPVLGFIERTNLAVDNAVRLAAYVEARKAGWSEADAASLSKNLTVNFNRRGEWGATINALYPFANAGIQGTQIMWKAFSSKRMAKYAVGMVGMALILDLVNASLSAEDDDGELAYDKIPDWKNRTNLTVMLGPDSENGLALWMPYGYSLFPYLGQQIGKVVRGVKEPGDAMRDFAAAMMGAFSPIGGFDFQGDAARDLQAMLTPTMLDPINEMAMNQDWLGRPIRPENPWSDYGPNAYKYFGGVSDVSKAIADVANRATGGTIAESGAVDISPEYIDHFFGFVTGGAGRFAGRLTDTVGKLMSGQAEDIEARNIPFYRSVQVDTGDWLDRDRYYRFRDEVKAAREAQKDYAQGGKTAPAHIRTLASLYGALSAADKDLRAASGRKKAVLANPNLTFTQRQKALRAIETQNASVYVRFNKVFLKRMGPQGE